MCFKEGCRQSACALIHPLQLFSSSSSCTFQVEATANKWLKVKAKYFIPCSTVSARLKAPGCAASRDRGYKQGQRGVDYSRCTSDKTVCPIISSDPSCDKPCFWVGVDTGE